MVSFRALALLAAASLVSAQELSTLDPCAMKCFNSANELFGALGCAAGDVSCMCKKPDWTNSINDCAKGSCPTPDYAATVTQAAAALCATAVPPPPPAAAAPTTSSASTPAAPTTTPPATTPPPASSSSSSSSSQTEAAKLSGKSSTSTPSSTASATKSAPTKSTTTSAAPASTSEPAGAVVGGMTTSAKIGLGVGITFAIVALIGAAVFFFLRRRQNSRNIPGPKHWKISEPMPSPQSRHYNNSDDFGHSYETGLSDLEMKSRRYEDMVPRQKPRQMV